VINAVPQLRQLWLLLVLLVSFSHL